MRGMINQLYVLHTSREPAESSITHDGKRSEENRHAGTCVLRDGGGRSFRAKVVSFLGWSATTSRVNAVNVGWTLTDNEHKLQRVEMGSENWIEEADKVIEASKISM